MREITRHIFSLLIVVIFPISVRASENLIESHLRPTIEDGFDRTGLIIIGAGVAATWLTQTLDYQMRGAWIDHQRMSPQAARVGDVLGTGIPGGLIALSQIIWLEQEAGTAHAEALLETMAVTYLLKYANQRARPSSENHLSMPSGHTSTTFASATSLTYFYGWRAAVPGYLLATFTAASRWADDAHWFSDTVAGAAIGIFWGRATAIHHWGNVYGRFTPFIDTKSVGLTWLTEF